MGPAGTVASESEKRGLGRGWRGWVAAGLLVHWASFLPRPVLIGLFTVAMLAGGWFLLPKAWRAVLRLRPDINLLVVIAAIGASIIGELAEAATVVFLFGVAEWLEGWADRRARRATEALLELAPKVATVKRDGQLPRCRSIKWRLARLGLSDLTDPIESKVCGNLHSDKTVGLWCRLNCRL